MLQVHFMISHADCKASVVQRLQLSDRMPIISTPSAAKAIEQLGFNPSVLQPGELLGKVGTVFQFQSPARSVRIKEVMDIV